MVEFNKTNPCPQCGSAASYKYHANLQDTPTCRGIPGVEEGVPHMHRVCGTCGYSWAEEPTV